MLEITYTPTAQNLLDFNYFTYWSDPGKKNLRIIAYAKQSIYAIGIFSIFLLIDGSFSIHKIWIPSILCIIFVILITPTFVQMQMANRVKRKLAKKENQILLDPISLTFSETGIDAKSTSSESKLQWSSIIRKVETKRNYFLYVAVDAAIIIPKEFITSPQDKKQLERLLDANLFL